MTYVSFFFIFFLVWWMVFYMTLSIGIKVPDSPQEGHAASAPTQPHLWRKALATTVIALLLTALLFGLVHYDIIDMRSITDPQI